MSSKVTKSGPLKGAIHGGPSGKIGKQGGATPAKSGKVSIPGNAKGGGKWGKGGPSGKVGGKTYSAPSKAGRVSVTGGR